MTVPADWSQLSHGQLYAAVNSGPGRAVSVAAEEHWTRIEATIADIQRRISSALADTNGGWEGVAADTTRRAVSPLGEWALDAAGDARLTAGAVVSQAEHAGELRRLLPPPAPEPAPQPAMITGRIGTPPASPAMVAQRAAADADARRLMRDYVNHSYENDQYLDYWTVPPTVSVDSAPVGPAGAGSGPAGGAHGVGLTAGAVPTSLAAAGSLGIGGAGVTAGGAGPFGTVPGGSGAGGAVGLNGTTAAGRLGGEGPAAGGPLAGDVPGGGPAAGGLSAGGLSAGGPTAAGLTAAGLPTVGSSTGRSTAADVEAGGARAGASEGSGSGRVTAGPESGGLRSGGSGSGGLGSGPLGSGGLGSGGLGSGGLPGRSGGGALDGPRAPTPGGDGSAREPTAGGRGPSRVTTPFGGGTVRPVVPEVPRAAPGPGWRDLLPEPEAVRNSRPGVLAEPLGRTAPIPEAAPARGGGAGLSGGMYPPMMGGGSGGRGGEHRRPGWLVDGTGAFADDRWFPPAVITPDDGLPPTGG